MCIHSLEGAILSKHTKHTLFGGREERPPNMKEAMYPGGLVVEPVPISADEEITILYNGLLSGFGADQVYLHCGYGTSQAWKDIEDIKMDRTEKGWEKRFTVNDSSRLNICFRDSVNNWDNNNGINWSFEIHDGARV